VNRAERRLESEREFMSNRTVSFVGGGRVTRILLEGWRRVNGLPGNTALSDCSAEASAKLKARFPTVHVGADTRVPAAQDIVFLAVHPPVMAEVASAIRGSLKAGALVVSLAPKFTIARLTPALKRMVCGSARTLLESGLTPAEVMDLIPVKPLVEMEPQVAEMHRTRLPGLYQRIKP